MYLGETVPLREQREDAARIGDEARFAEAHCIGRCGQIATDHQDGQTLMRLAQRFDDRTSRTLERHAADIEAGRTRGIGGEQPFDGRAVGTDEHFAGVLRIGEAGFQQDQQIALAPARRMPVNTDGTDAGKTTFTNSCNGLRPIERAERISKGSTLRTPHWPEALLCTPIKMAPQAFSLRRHSVALRRDRHAVLRQHAYDCTVSATSLKSSI